MVVIYFITVSFARFVYVIMNMSSWSLPPTVLWWCVAAVHHNRRRIL